MPDDVLVLEDAIVCNLIGGEEGIWDGSQQPPWRLTWTASAGIPLSMGLAECLADFAVPFDLT